MTAVPVGTLTLGSRRFPIRRATLRRITDDGSGRPGWEVDVRTGEPLGVGDEDPFRYAELRLFAEGDPIPLPDAADLTGQVVRFEAPYDDESGDPYLTLYAFEHRDVSHVTWRFLERDGVRYRIALDSRAHGVEDEPVSLSLECWITRLPPRTYGRPERLDARQLVERLGREPPDHEARVQLEIFLAERLAASGAWQGRSTDGISSMRVVERDPSRVRVVGRVWEIDQTQHVFFVELDASARWALWYDVDEAATTPRLARNAADVVQEPADAPWVIACRSET